MWKLIPLVLLYTVTSKLLYVATVLRHGARYPISDMYDGKDTSKFHGQLTTIGMRQQYLLGSYMRADYIAKDKLINSTLNPKELEAFSDDSERCVESTICYLMGLFPFGSGNTIPDGINKNMLDPPFQSFLSNNLRTESLLAQEFGLEKGFQPVPYFNASQFFPTCPNDNIIYSNRLRVVATQLAKFQAEQAAFTDKMRLVFNLTTDQSTVAGLFDLYDVVISDKYLGRPMPDNFSDYDFDQLKFVQDYYFTLTYGGDPAKIYSTSVMKGILANMNAAKDPANKKKFSVYSTHGASVMALLNFFNLTSPPSRVPRRVSSWMCSRSVASRHHQKGSSNSDYPNIIKI